MNSIRPIPSLALLLFLSACAGLGVHMEHEPGVDLSAYRSFAWAPPQRGDDAEVEDPILDSPFMDRKVGDAVRDVLSDRGYDEVGADQADFYVSYHTSRRERRDSSGMTVGVGVGHVWPHRYGFYSVTNDAYDSYPEGTLVIDIVDAESDRLVWRGWKSSRVSQQAFDEDRVRVLVGDILSRFPPQ